MRELIAGEEDKSDGESDATVEKGPAGEEEEEVQEKERAETEDEEEADSPVGRTLGLNSRYHLEMYRLSLREEADEGYFFLSEVETMLTAMWHAGARSGLYHYQMSHAFFRCEEMGADGVFQ